MDHGDTVHCTVQGDRLIRMDHLLLEKQEYSTEMNINQGRNIFIFRQEDAG